MIDSLLKLVLVLLVTSSPLLLAWGMCKLVVRSERKEWKKKFDAIHRGDKFIQWLDNDNPFKWQYGQIVEITGKASVCGKRFYLEYKIGEAPVAIYDSCSIQDFFDIYHYIPYNYQDEQS
mgnify:CR=1 FL=1